MLSVIISALVSSLSEHMFTKILNNMDKVEIGGAPSWYMHPVSDEMCVFTHKSGGYDSIDISKNNANIKMIKNIDGLIEIAIYDSTKHIKSDKEKQLIKRWSNDEQLNIFVNKNLYFSKITFEDEINTSFVRACIPNKTILSYQKVRLQNIKKSLLTYKTNNAIDELDRELEKDFNKKKD